MSIIITVLLITCLSGIIQEVQTLLDKTPQNIVKVPYAAGSIFFLFWHEPYINLGLIWALLIFSIIDFLATGKTFENKIKKLNSALCLVTLVALLINLCFYFV